MIDKSSIDKLNALNLDELVDILHRQESVAEFISMPFDQRLQFAIDDFYSVRMEQNYKRLLAKAHLKYPGASFHSIEYMPERNILAKFQAHHNHTSYPEEYDIITRYERSSRIKLL